MISSYFGRVCSHLNGSSMMASLLSAGMPVRGHTVAQVQDAPSQVGVVPNVNTVQFELSKESLQVCHRARLIC
jgi:hypothetical protein